MELTGLQKVAIVINAMSKENAEKTLANLSKVESQKIIDIIKTIETLDNETKTQVINNFYNNIDAVSKTNLGS